MQADRFDDTILVHVKIQNARCRTDEKLKTPRLLKSVFSSSSWSLAVMALKRPMTAKSSTHELQRLGFNFAEVIGG